MRGRYLERSGGEHVWTCRFTSEPDPQATSVSPVANLTLLIRRSESDDDLPGAARHGAWLRRGYHSQDGRAIYCRRARGAQSIRTRVERCACCEHVIGDDHNAPTHACAPSDAIRSTALLVTRSATAASLADVADFLEGINDIGQAGG